MNPCKFNYYAINNNERSYFDMPWLIDRVLLNNVA